MKSKSWLLINLILVLSGVWNFSCYARLLSEQPCDAAKTPYNSVVNECKMKI